MKNKGILVIVSGFSGAGKGTLMRRLLEKYDNYALSVSATSRKPRDYEQEGVHYFFKSKQEFEQLIRDGKLIEYAKYVDNYYGTPSDYVFSQMKDGKDVILEIEMQGALQVKERYPDTVLIFVMPPSMRELERRLFGRGSEEEAVIHARLNRAAKEVEYIDHYDYIIVNDKLEECVDKLHQIIQGQHNKTSQQKEFIEKMRKEFKVF